MNLFRRKKGKVRIYVKADKYTHLISDMNANLIFKIAHQHDIDKFDLFINGKKIEDETKFPKRIKPDSIFVIEPFDI